MSEKCNCVIFGHPAKSDPPIDPPFPRSVLYKGLLVSDQLEWPKWPRMLNGLGTTKPGHPKKLKKEKWGGSPQQKPWQNCSETHKIIPLKGHPNTLYNIVNECLPLRDVAFPPETPQNYPPFANIVTWIPPPPPPGTQSEFAHTCIIYPKFKQSKSTKTLSSDNLITHSVMDFIWVS